MIDFSARIEALLAEGINHQSGERFAEAERSYRAALQLDPANPQALGLLGMLAGMFGHFQPAIDLFLKALERDPDNADLYHNLGETYRHLGEIGKAIPAFNRALELRPDHIASFRSAADTAIEAADKATSPIHAAELRRMATKFLLPLANQLRIKNLGGIEEALREAMRASPENAEAVHMLAALLQEQGQPTDAAQFYRRAIELDPSKADYHNGLGNALYALQRWDDMERAYHAAIAIDAAHPLARRNLASTRLMPPLYDDTISPDEIFERHRAWGQASMRAVAAESARAAPFTNSREPERRLRVAFLSGDFGNHPVGHFVRPLFTALDRTTVEVFCYSELEKPDEITKSLQRLDCRWRNTNTLDDAALRAQLRTDSIDIAIDLAGHSAKNRLSALAVRAAPVTATWLGYPATTGLATIDWRFTDAIADPPGQEAFHTEKLMRLPNGFLCYQPSTLQAPEVEALPAKRWGTLTFGSFNNPHKISDSTIRCWAAILGAVPHSRLLLKAAAFGDPGIRQSFLDRFAACGVPAKRISLHSFAADTAAHLAAYGGVDIALDPFPYNGTTTTCEALWMGVPVISLIGTRHAGRVGLDLLSRIGLTELAAADIDAYVATATALAGDLPRLERMRIGMRDRMRSSVLYDSTGFAADFADALRDMWRDYCRPISSDEPVVSA